MGQDDTGDLVSVLYQSIHNMHLLKFLQQFCSGAWDTANGKHIRGFELNTITTSNYELNKFHGIRRGMPSRWLGSWPPKVNAVFRKLQCQFMLGDVWVCSVGSWIHPEMNHFFFFLFTEIAFQPYHQTDNQSQHGQGGGEQDYSSSLSTGLHCRVTVAACSPCVSIRPQCQHRCKYRGANEKAVFPWWCHTWSWLSLRKCLWYFLPNHKRLHFCD